jgi:hypothetical protein
MELYIQIRNGVPYEHPIVEDNFLQAFPNIDLNNLPPEFARFTRISESSARSELEPSVFQELEHSYVLDTDNITWKDGWQVRDMTADERAQRIAAALLSSPYPSWLFNEEICKWEPPTPMPETGVWEWDETTTSWIVFVPPEPDLSDVTFN